MRIDEDAGAQRHSCERLAAAKLEIELALLLSAIRRAERYEGIESVAIAQLIHGRPSIRGQHGFPGWPDSRDLPGPFHARWWLGRILDGDRDTRSHCRSLRAGRRSGPEARGGRMGGDVPVQSLRSGVRADRNAW